MKLMESGHIWCFGGMTPASDAATLSVSFDQFVCQMLMICGLCALLDKMCGASYLDLPATFWASSFCWNLYETFADVAQPTLLSVM